MKYPFVHNVCNPGNPYKKIARAVADGLAATRRCNLGDFGSHDGCVVCPRVDVCIDAKSASEASLSSLPIYITSRHIAVRRIAEFRFTELQERVPPKQLLMNRLKQLPRFLRNFPTTSHKI